MQMSMPTPTIKYHKNTRTSYCSNHSATAVGYHELIQAYWALTISSAETSKIYETSLVTAPWDLTLGGVKIAG